jgi:hypothetical protein
MEQAIPTFPDRKVAERMDWREFLELAKQVQAEAAAAEGAQEYATVRIDTDRPIAIQYSGDWHLGAHSDYEGWAKDIQLVLESPELYLIDHGDDIQNMRMFKDLSGVLSQVLTPRQQNEMLYGIVDELTTKGKLLAKIGGNHDEEFDERLFGEALQSYLLQNLACPRFHNRGLLRLEIGQETYTNVVYHKSRFSSFLRACHDAYREYELFFPADVVSGAHLHRPGIEAMWHYNNARDNGFNFGGLTYLIKVGSPMKSRYGWKYFAGEAYVAPTVVFYPDRHKKLVFVEAEDALHHIRCL